MMKIVNLFHYNIHNGKYFPARSNYRQHSSVGVITLNQATMILAAGMILLALVSSFFLKETSLKEVTS